ncbi:unnamed protein product [marine sediment metagenome]|uniref:Cobalamin adenosyltransferase-like domain-containing protein n=1 Tax=marine sediment metagenome TaxID=412755 RepID=X1BR14_9ZZZZ
MAKIYTKTGDKGITTLADGRRIKKTSAIIEFYGNLDELNSFLGWAQEALHGKVANQIRLFNSLFNSG